MMDIPQQKLDLIKWIGNIEDETLIRQLNSIKNNEFPDLENISSKDIKSIQKGIKQVENGQTTSYEEMMKQRQWLQTEPTNN